VSDAWWAAVMAETPFADTRRAMHAFSMANLIQPRWTMTPDLNPANIMPPLPAPHMIQCMMSLQGEFGHSAMVIGANANSIRAASDAGAFAVGVAAIDDKSGRDALLHAGAHALIESFDIEIFEDRLKHLRVKHPRSAGPVNKV
jgi:phosphoglycolate phosphatase-like HAD superfamily hydrolase